MTIPENICLDCLNKVKRVKLKLSDCRFDNPYPSFCAACGEYKAIVTGLTWRGMLKTVGKR